jgi:ABC-type cobalamin/Fe3+-siderophores transport system ATPase subunit
MIQFDDVHVSYGRQRVLQGLNFMAADGRVTGLVGPNGAGKSTAFKILLGLLPPDRGAAQIDGVPFTRHRGCRVSPGPPIPLPTDVDLVGGVQRPRRWECRQGAIPLREAVPRSSGGRSRTARSRRIAEGSDTLV